MRLTEERNQHETARVHHAARRRGSSLAARSARLHAVAPVQQSSLLEMVESRLHLVKMRVLPSTHAFVFGTQQRSFIGFPGLGTASFVAASMSPVSTTSMGVLNVRAGFSFALSR